MTSTRIAWAPRGLMILAMAAFPAAAAQAEQSAGQRPGELGAIAPAEEALADEPLVASPETFGTSYITVNGTDFKPFYAGEWDYSGSGVLRHPTTGFGFLTAEIDLPNGVTVSEIELYVVDNNATANASLFVYRGTPHTNVITGLATGATAGASGTVATYPMTFTPYVVNAGTQRLFVGMTGPLNSTIAIAGARVGYTGGPGELIMFPAPDRFVDTRPATARGGKNTKYVDGEAFDHTITGVAGRDGNIIPAGAKGVLGNVTAVSPTQNGQFKILPGGTATTAGTSSVNFNAGFNTANAFTVRFNSAGQIRAFHSSVGGSTDLTVDIVGYYR